MAGHMRKNASKNRILIILLFLISILLTAAIFAGALLAGSDRAADRGTVLPDGAVLQDNNCLVSMENGGFVVVSSNESETRLAFLTRDGALVDEEIGVQSLPHLAERVIVCGDFLYIAGWMPDSTSGEMLCGITRLPLHSSNFSGLETFSYDFTLHSLNLQSLCADELGSLYAVESSANTIVRFSPDEIEKMETVSLPAAEAAVPDGLAIVGDTVYISGHQGTELLLWRGTLFDGTITDLEVLSGKGATFPLTFLTEELVLDDMGMLFSITETGFMQQTAAPVFYGAVLGDNGELVVSTGNGNLKVFSLKDLDTPVASYVCDGEITAIACHGGVAVLVYGGNSYRLLLLDPSDFYSDAESHLSSDDLWSGESRDSSGDESSSPSSEPDIPIYSEPEENGAESSEPDDDGAGNLPMADQITSTRFSVDREAGVVYLPEGTTVAQFRSTVPLHGATLSAYQYNGSVFQSGPLGTGMTLRLYNGDEVKDTVTVIVLGDLNGNGVVNSADERLLYQHLTEEQLLTGYFYSAADMDQDATVDTRDLLLLKQQLSH